MNPCQPGSSAVEGMRPVTLALLTRSTTADRDYSHEHEAVFRGGKAEGLVRLTSAI